MHVPERFRNVVRHPPFLVNLIFGFILYGLWFLLIENWLMLHYPVNKHVNYAVSYSGWYLLYVLGYNVKLLEYGWENYIIIFQDKTYVNVGEGCNGLEIYALFAGILLLLPGPVKHKFWYIALGIILLFLSNALRVALLALDKLKNTDLFHFNHKYTYVFLLYAFVFALWLGWLYLFVYKKPSDA